MAAEVTMKSPRTDQWVADVLADVVRIITGALDNPPLEGVPDDLEVSFSYLAHTVTASFYFNEREE